MKLFKDPKAIQAEVGKLRQAEKFRREDRAIVSNFFNGSPPLTDAEAEELGFTINVNHLFGYKELTDASDQMFGLFTKPETLITVDLDVAPPGKRSDWGMKIAQEASRVMKLIPRFKTAYQGVCGDGTLHGEALFFYPNTTFPLPKQCPLSRMLIPDDASTDVKELTHFGIEAPFSLKDLRWYWERSPKGWNKSNLSVLMNKIYEGCVEGNTISPENMEEAEYARQRNSASNSGRGNVGKKLEVVYFYQQRTDLPGSPYDLEISLQGAAGEDGKNIIYSGEAIIPRIEDCLHPFFMDCIIGGAPEWHRVLGLGTLNYQLNQAIELLVNRAQQATIEGSMNLWQATNSSTRDAVQQILMKHNGVIPEGINLVANRYQPNFGGILEMVQFFRQAASKNARGVTPNNGEQNDQLEVQAMAEMNQGASSANNRTSNWYDYMDRMYSEAVSRLANPYIDPDEPGYSECMDFQGALRRHRIPLYYAQRANLQVRAVRLVGDGLRQKELTAVSYLTANRSQYAPEVQPQITRICTGLALDNYRLAEELTPIQQEPDSPQLMRADNENAIMMTQRTPQKAKADDIDEIHVIQHFPAMELLIADALQFQKAAFTPQQAQAFQVIGGHILMHTKRIEDRAMNNRNDPERDKARMFKDHLNQVAAMGEKLLNNMQQTQGGEDQGEMDPVEMAKLQLQAQALSLQRDKLAHSVEKFERTQGTREQSMAFEQMLKLEKDHRESRKQIREGMRGDIETSLKVASAGTSGQ